MEIEGWRKHRMAKAEEKAEACGRYLCFIKENKGLWRVRLGTKMAVSEPGWGPKERIPAMAASAAARMGSWVTLKPRSMRVPSK